MKNPKTNPKFDKLRAIHKEIEGILLRCQVYENNVQYPDIVDGLTRVLKAINEVKINIIKDLQSPDGLSNLEE